MCEHRIRMADGTFRWHLSRALSVREDEGRIKWFGTTTDIHAVKAAEEALQEANVRLVEADRQKDEFLAMLGHELRNPLAGLAMAVAIIERPGVDEAKLRRMHAMCRRQLDTLTRLVDDLLDISRITRGRVELQREQLDLRAPLRSALESVESLFEESRHQLSVTLPDEPIPVVGDPVRLEQITSNLLTNAGKYTEPHGHITVTLQRAADCAELRVTDNGIGIEPDMLDHIFSLFGQGDRGLDRAHGGLGIGLTVVKHLVEHHGGHIKASSRGRGSGAEFTVTLPLAAAVEAPSDEVRSEPAPAGAARRILVVDDNADAADGLAALLETSGHSVWVARDGYSALHRAEEVRPELVFLDIGMPGIDGYEVARRLRRNPHTRNAVIVAVTGYGQARDRAATASAGFDAHFVKPVDSNALERFVGQCKR